MMVINVRMVVFLKLGWIVIRVINIKMSINGCLVVCLNWFMFLLIVFCCCVKI